MVSTPHDALFKATFSDLARAAEEIRHVFPPEVIAQMDLSTLALVSGSFVDSELRQYHTDILYSVRFAGQRALVYILLEHESSHDRWLPLWLLVYITRIWESLVRDNALPRGRLPPILPAVVHHGERGWQASTHFEALIDLPPDAPAAVWAHIPRFCFALDDLTATSTDALRKRQVSLVTRVVFLALKETRTVEDAVQLMHGLIDLLRQMRHEQDMFREILWYIGSVRGAKDHRTIIDILARKLGPKEAQVMQTMWEAAEEQGERRGLAKGRQEGLEAGRLEARLEALERSRKRFTRMLQRRFGDLPASVLARIESADEASLDRWSEEFFDAPSLEALFPAV